MFERWITALHIEDVGDESPDATRARLKDRFPRNATRRMTQLGLLIGVALEALHPEADDALIYASAYAETRALEAYLDSFPTPSPTLFQTSIHPSAVQQILITRQQALRQFLPLTGGQHLVIQALLTACLADSPRVLLCGGEERGTWLLEHERASDRSFAFALALSATPSTSCLARIRIKVTDTNSAARPDVALRLPAFFDLLRTRSDFEGTVLAGRHLTLTWSA